MSGPQHARNASGENSHGSHREFTFNKHRPRILLLPFSNRTEEEETWHAKRYADLIGLRRPDGKHPDDRGERDSDSGTGYPRKEQDRRSERPARRLDYVQRAQALELAPPPKVPRLKYSAALARTKRGVSRRFAAVRKGRSGGCAPAARCASTLISAAV